MKLDEKLQQLRKQNGHSQEQLAEELGIARQTVSKWETGQAVPELPALIALSNLYGISIDRLVKEDDACAPTLTAESALSIDALTAFLLRAKRRTYAGKGSETTPSRAASHDFACEEGEYAYYDTYLGGEQFAGEEAVWHRGMPVWSMNYVGRVTGENFSGDFLKEALLHVPHDRPFRGPAVFEKGGYRYHCISDGEFSWFHGYEEIFYQQERIYECRFHGGLIR